MFRVGGRMQLRWMDPRQAFDPAVVGTERLEYQGQSVLEQLEDEVWWPDLEFVNAVGPRDRLSVNLTLDADGEVWYRERFDVHIAGGVRAEARARALPNEKATAVS